MQPRQGRPARNRVNRVWVVLLVIGIVAMMLWAAGTWANVNSWGGINASDAYTFFRQLGISAMTVSAIMTRFASLASQFLILALAALIGLLFVSAVRWQRAHTR